MKPVLVRGFRLVHAPEAARTQTALISIRPKEKVDDYHQVIVDMSDVDGRFQVIENRMITVPESAVVHQYTREEWDAASDLEDFLSRLSESRNRVNKPLPPRNIRRK